MVITTHPNLIAETVLSHLTGKERLAVFILETCYPFRQATFRNPSFKTHYEK